MQRATFNDGGTVEFDRTEEHGAHVLFFREPVGLVYAKNKHEIAKIEELHGNDKDKHTPRNP